MQHGKNCRTAEIDIAALEQGGGNSRLSHCFQESPGAFIAVTVVARDHAETIFAAVLNQIFPGQLAAVIIIDPDRYQRQLRRCIVVDQDDPSIAPFERIDHVHEACDIVRVGRIIGYDAEVAIGLAVVAHEMAK
ncbi:hypothetical protein SDC9_203601 [bioreactor metagenome]|uniref:Uncharacterized protein n=1 Tax=bioreactor metagenome TaxID=1076179 RepID=A0A645IXP6_9ZZZZ